MISLLLIVKHMNFGYPHKANILEDINISMDEGCFLGILGQNGAGKSTFLKCINKICEHKDGEILIEGTNIQTMTLSEIARKIAYVPQYTTAQFPTTVMNLVMMGRIPYSGYSFNENDRKLARHALKEMGLTTFALRDVRHLSGGERQRAFIARALAGNPKIMLMDEPTSSLDIYHQLEVLSLIRNLVRKTKLSVVMVIHDLNMASMFCDRVVLLKDKTIWKGGTPEEVLTGENIEQVYHVKTFTTFKDEVKYIQPVDPDLWIR